MRFSPPLSVKAEAVKADGTFAGYASVFGGRDSYGDRVLPGAFAASLQAHQKAGTAPALLWQHDQREPVGRWLELREDATGLHVEGRLTLATTRGQDALALLKDGALSGLSIGFRIPDGGAVMAGEVRELRQVDLAEISLVTLPADSHARVREVRSFDSPRDLEEALRDAGLSRRQARALLAKGWSGLQADADDARTINNRRAALAGL